MRLNGACNRDIPRLTNDVYRSMEWKGENGAALLVCVCMIQMT